MDHNCAPGCVHWCDASPTHRHRWVIETKSTPSGRGHCRHCGKARKFGGGVGRHAITATEINAQAEERLIDL